jgi:hypothetical protein
MYRLTLADHHVEAYRKSHAHTPIWQRVYRWENKWGTHMPGRWDDAWRAEIRTEIASDGDTQLLERVTPIQSIPYIVDDIWEEQVMVDKHITCGGLLTITGTLYDIQETVRNLQIVLAPSICECIDTERKRNLLPRPVHQETPLQQQSGSKPPVAMSRAPLLRQERYQSQQEGSRPQGYAHAHARRPAYDPRAHAQRSSQERTFRGPQVGASGRVPSNEVHYGQRRSH